MMRTQAARFHPVQQIGPRTRTCVESSQFMKLTQELACIQSYVYSRSHQPPTPQGTDTSTLDLGCFVTSLQVLVRSTTRQAVSREDLHVPER